jgi:hypothetical protein
MSTEKALGPSLGSSGVGVGGGDGAGEKDVANELIGRVCLRVEMSRHELI